MLKRSTLAIAAVLLLLPMVLFAAPRFGAGARIDAASGGFEFRFWIPTQSGANAFIAPQAIGIYTASSSSDYYFYNFGLRGGLMFRPQNWVSPLVGVGVGYGSKDGDYSHLGVRAFVGISVAPFQYSAKEIGWLSGLAGLRFEFDTGILYRVDIYSQHFGTFEDSDHLIWLPDAGAGFVFSW